MALEFTCSATPLDNAAIVDAAKRLGCKVAAVRAVIDVESGGGFLPDGRPKILFERHCFSRLTKGRFDASHPGVSSGAWGGYGAGGAHQYDRLAEAIGCDRDAALRSAGWGMCQIMGDNCGAAGFGDVEAYVKAMISGEPAQLDSFVAFVRKTGLDDELARRDWAGFARGYNGPANRENRYDAKLLAAFIFNRHAASRTDSPKPTLRLGDGGKTVIGLQTLLGIEADGDFGLKTKAAVMAFQKKHGLLADGISGRDTWAALSA